MVAKKKVPKKAAKPAPVEEKEEKAEPLVVQKNIDLSSFGYPIPKGWDAQKNKIVVLKDQGDDAQKHLAVIVTDMFQKSIHLSLGEPDFFTAMRNQLNLSSGWIKNLLTSIKIYDDMGAAELKKDVERKKWLEVGTTLQGLGKPKDFKRTSFNQKTTNGVTEGEFEYQVTWEKAAGKFVLKTKLEDNKWKVLGVRYDTTK